MFIRLIRLITLFWGTYLQQVIEILERYEFRFHDNGFRSEFSKVLRHDFMGFINPDFDENDDLVPRGYSCGEITALAARNRFIRYTAIACCEKLWDHCIDLIGSGLVLLEDSDFKRMSIEGYFAVISGNFEKVSLPYISQSEEAFEEIHLMFKTICDYIRQYWREIPLENIDDCLSIVKNAPTYYHKVREMASDVYDTIKHIWLDAFSLYTFPIVENLTHQYIFTDLYPNWLSIARCELHREELESSLLSKWNHIYRQLRSLRKKPTRQWKCIFALLDHAKDDKLFRKYSKRYCEETDESVNAFGSELIDEDRETIAEIVDLLPRMAEYRLDERGPVRDESVHSMQIKLYVKVIDHINDRFDVIPSEWKRIEERVKELHMKDSSDPEICKLMIDLEELTCEAVKIANERIWACPPYEYHWGKLARSIDFQYTPRWWRTKE